MSEMKVSDHLAQIFERQKKLNEQVHFYATEFSKMGRELATRDLIIAMSSELSEIMNCTDWKWWKQPKKRTWTDEGVKEIQEEIIDLFHFVICLALVWGMTPESFFETYMNKADVNKDRFTKAGFEEV